MADEVAGGLSADTEDTVIKETRPKAGGLTLGGAKGVSLDPEQSMEVRNRLLEMIKQREAERSGWGPILEKFALPMAPIDQLSNRIGEFNARQQQRDQDIFNMQLGVSQLDTERARILAAKQQEAADRAQFGQMLTGGVGGAGGEGGAGVGNAALNNLSLEQKAALFMLHKKNPTMGLQKLLELTKQTDAEREALAAGLTPGSAEYQSFMKLKLGGSGAFIPHDVRTEEGTQQQTPLQAASGPLGGPAPAPATAAPAGGLSVYDRLTAPQTAAPAPAPAPAARPAPAAPVARSTPIANVPTGFKPGSKEDLAARAEREKARIATEQKAAEVPIAGATKESEKIGEASAAEQTVHSDNVKLAPSNAIIATQLEKDISSVPGLVGKLNRPTFASAFANALDKGVQLGQFGSLSIPVVKDLVVQLDPEVRKDPKKLEAYQRVINNISKIGLEFARAVNKGMGSMSNYERSIVEQAVGDPTRLTANNLMLKAKALELDAKNAMEKDKLWNQMNKAGMSWKEFKGSSEYKDLERKQFYRTAKVMHVPDAKFPGDQ